VMKAVLSILSGSLAITASAIDSGTDAVASLAIYFGVLLSERKTRVFPMGLYKLENIASVVIAIFIFIAGYEMVQQILRPVNQSLHIVPLHIFLLFAGTVCTYFFGRYASVVGKKTASPTLIAEGRHRQVDAFSSMVVLVSITLSYYGLSVRFVGLSVDQIGAVIILVFIVKAGWELLLDGMRVLLDASIDAETLHRIRGIIRSEPLVAEINSLLGRSAGRFRFIQGAITLKTKNLEEAQQIGEKIETKIRTHIPHIERVMIHYGPQKRSHVKLALPLSDPEGRISTHFGEAPYFAFVWIRNRDQRVENKMVLENPYQKEISAKGIQVAEWLIEKGVAHVGIKESILHKGPGYVLSNGGVQIHTLRSETIDQSVEEIVSKGA